MASYRVRFMIEEIKKFRSNFSKRILFIGDRSLVRNLMIRVSSFGINICKFLLLFIFINIFVVEWREFLREMKKNSSYSFYF